MHSHHCRICGNTWTHPDSSKGSVPAHTCATCGNVVWDRWTPEQELAEQMWKSVHKYLDTHPEVVERNRKFQESVLEGMDLI